MMSSPESGESQVARRLGLRLPLSRELTDSREPRRDHDNWGQIAARLEGVERHGRLGSWLARWFALGERGAVWRLALVAAVLVGVGGFGVLRWRGVTSGPLARDQAGLRLLDGQEFTGVHLSDPPAPDQRAVALFEDGSNLRALEPDTHLEALALTERDVILRLVRGTVSVQVTKGGPRKWTIEAGSLRVEVVGTAFEVSRRGDQHRVTVSEGVVLVRSPELPDGVRRLKAGEQVAVEPSAPVTYAAPSSAAPAEMADTAQLAGTASPKPPSAPPTASHWFEAADSARLHGDWATAAQALQTVLRQFPKDPRAELAAFQLAVVRQNGGAPKSEVAAAFATALSQLRSASLRQDCYWRLVQLADAMGDDRAARRWVRAALDEYPDGRYSQRLRARAQVER